MTLPSVEPCVEWPMIGCVDLSPNESAISGTMRDVAQEILYYKTGMQFDQCSVTLRPCRDDCFGGVFPWSERWNQWGVGWPFPYLYAGQWFNLGCPGCAGSCSCSTVSEVLLPHPIYSVDDVTIDGVSLTPLDEHVIVYDHRRLIRIDGETWPLCNDFSKDDGEVGTWTITVTTGTPVPQLGQVALGELTRELINACTGAACRLPTNVQQVVRQGVSQTLFDPTEVFADGKLGLYFSDLFISTYNPQGIRDRARVINVEKHGPKYKTWPSP